MLAVDADTVGSQNYNNLARRTVGITCSRSDMRLSGPSMFENEAWKVTPSRAARLIAQPVPHFEVPAEQSAVQLLRRGRLPVPMRYLICNSVYQSCHPWFRPVVRLRSWAEGFIDRDGLHLLCGPALLAVCHLSFFLTSLLSRICEVGPRQ